MKFINLTILSLVLSLICLSVCEASNHEKNSKTQLSTLKEKNNMQPSSPMLNEIFASEKYIRPGQSKDVSYIVSKYLPIGSSKKEVIDKLNKMNQHYSDKGHIIYAGYGKQIHPMIPNPEVMIELKFNASGYLENIDSQFYYAQ